MVKEKGIISRRSFFKRAASMALPILGATILTVCAEVSAQEASDGRMRRLVFTKLFTGVCGHM